MEILENPPGRGQKRPGRGRKRPGRGQEEARRGQEKATQNGRNPEFAKKKARNAMCYEQKMTSLAAPENWRFWRIQEKAKKRPEEARKRPEEARKKREEAREARKRPEKARKRPEEARKRPGRGQSIRKKAPKRQESRIWRKTARNAMCYEQKMTSLEGPEFWRFWRTQEKAKQRPGRGQKRPGRGQEKARRGQEEARRGPKKPGSRIWRKIARNAMFHEQKMTSLAAFEFWRFWRIQKRP